MNNPCATHRRQPLISNRTLVFITMLGLSLIFGLGVPMYFAYQNDEMMAEQAAWEASLTQEQADHIAQMRSELFYSAEKGTMLTIKHGGKIRVAVAIDKADILGKLTYKKFLDQSDTTDKNVLTDDQFLLSVIDVEHYTPNNKGHGTLASLFLSQNPW